MKFLAVLLLSACSILHAGETLTLPQIEADPKIWPVEVMVTVDHKLPVIVDGKTVRTLKIGPGNMYKVKSISAAGVTVYALGGPKTFVADDTDVIARAEQNKARLDALAAAPPAPPIPTANPPPPRPVSQPAVPNARPFTIELPPGFVEITPLRKPSMGVFFTFNKGQPESEPGPMIQFGIADVPDANKTTTADKALRSFVERSRQIYTNLKEGDPTDGLLGVLPARVLPWKAIGPHGLEVSGKAFVSVQQSKVYWAQILDAEPSTTSNPLPVLSESLNSLKFIEGYPTPTAPKGLAAKLTGQLVSLKDNRFEPFDTANLANKKYLAVYFSASWCGPCRQFTPALVEWYRKRQSFRDQFDIIFVSADRKEGDMLSYMAGDRMEWPAVSFNKGRLSPLAKYAGDGIPCLVILDENGSVLSSSYVGGNYVGPMKPLMDLDRLLTGS